MRFVEMNGEALAALREARGLDQEELAGLLAKDLGRSVHATSISKYETEARSPRPKRFEALCRVLKCEREDLLKIKAVA